MFFFICLASSSIVGLDLGSDHIRCSILRPGKQIGILYDQEGRRLFPAVLTVVPHKRPIPNIINDTDVADFQLIYNDQNSQFKNPNSTISHFSNFIAKSDTPDFIDLNKRRMLLPQYSVTLNHRLVTAGVLPEIIFHKLLREVNKTAERDQPGSPINPLVITVPKFFPQLERSSLRSIARSLDMHPYVIDSSRAAATYFALEFQRHYTRKNMTVAFFDMGSSNTQITIVVFSKTDRIQAKEIVYDWTDSIGGRDFDIKIVDLLKEQYGKPLTQKIEKIFIEEAVKIKNRLTTDTAYSGLIDLLDFKYSISRQLFVSSSQSYIEGIRTIIASIGVPVDRVQMLGGMSRVPCIQDAVRDAFGVDKVHFSMNSEESIAVGAGYVGAGMSGQYKLPNIEYTSIEPYNISIRTRDTSLSFNGTLPFANEDVWIYHEASKFPLGSSPFIVWDRVDENTNLTATPDGLIRLKNKRDGVFFWKHLALSVAKEAEKQEIERKLLEQAVNSLEKMIFLSKSVIFEGGCATDIEKVNLKRVIEQTDKWFLDQREFKRSTVEKRLEMLEDAVGAVMLRHENEEKLSEAIKRLEKLRKNVEKHMTKLRRPKRKEIRYFLRMLAEIDLWLEEKRSLQGELKNTEDPKLRHYDLDDMTSEVEMRLKTIKEAYKTSNKRKKHDEGVYVYPPNSANVEIN